MIKYKISYKFPHRHFIDFELSTKTNNQKKVVFQLPAWRPGRYELANFAQNIQKWQAFDENGNTLIFRKKTKDLWEVDTDSAKEIIIKYNYYANQLDAGACYLDELQLYINPVHCCFYIPSRINEEYLLEFDIPKNYDIASAVKSIDNNIYISGFDALAENPIICSANLKKEIFNVEGVIFYIWFQGWKKPNWKKIKNDFKSFIISQINHFGSFPVKEYHFLFQITPYRSYHGVEHSNNTVILLGPDTEIDGKYYNDLLGVSSHELYHTWNIKSIRPIEMLPYDYSKENYFKTGFVAEGVTTYMGDLMLYNSNVFSWKEFLATQNKNLERHIINSGRFNLSVADSGFDSWLDGYKLGIPNRKVSIYADAALCMLMIDLTIINYSNGKNSLHDVMKELYLEYGIKKKGYSEQDFKNICLKYGNSETNDVFTNHIYNTKDYIPNLNKYLDYVGMELSVKSQSSKTAKYFGFITQYLNNKHIIKLIELDSEIDLNGVSVEDELLLIDGKKVKHPIIKSLENLKSKTKLTFKNKFKKFSLDLSLENKYFELLEFKKMNTANSKQIKMREKWLS